MDELIEGELLPELPPHIFPMIGSTGQGADESLQFALFQSPSNTKAGCNSAPARCCSQSSGTTEPTTPSRWHPILEILIVISDRAEQLVAALEREAQYDFRFHNFGGGLGAWIPHFNGTTGHANKLWHSWGRPGVYAGETPDQEDDVHFATVTMQDGPGYRFGRAFDLMTFHGDEIDNVLRTTDARTW